MTVKIYEVGGAVRDSFIGRVNNDIDFAVEAGSYSEMRDFILSTGGTIFLETPQYVTIRAKWSPLIGGKKIPCDFTLCRKESGYSDNRHPDYIEAGTILEDLSRRDFTINAMARDVSTGEIIDPYNGLQDIQDRFIRCVRDARERFNEDSLRILRALRFAVTLDFKLAPTVIYAIGELSPLIENVSRDRVREELTKMFKHNTVAAMKILYDNFSYVSLSRLFKDDIWLKPTTEQ